MAAWHPSRTSPQISPVRAFLRIADFRNPENQLVGAIFVGEVDRVSREMNSSFIKLPNEKKGFLKGNKHLKSGDRIVLQSTNFTPIDKAIVVTQNVSFKGKYVIITSKNKRISFSKNVKETLSKFNPSHSQR